MNSSFLLKLTGVVLFLFAIKYQAYHLLSVTMCIGSCAEPSYALWDLNRPHPTGAGRVGPLGHTGHHG